MDVYEGSPPKGSRRENRPNMLGLNTDLVEPFMPWSRVSSHLRNNRPGCPSVTRRLFAGMAAPPLLESSSSLRGRQMSMVWTKAITEFLRTHLIGVGFGLTILYWIIETADDAFLFHMGTFAERLFPMDVNEV